MKKQIIRVAATTALGLSLTTGFASASTGTINQTGASSKNTISHNRELNSTVRNNADVRVRNNNDQVALSGDATSSKNTTQNGGTTSGSVGNDNMTDTSVRVSNNSSSAPVMSLMDDSHSGSASISNTGFQSDNKITSNTTSNTTVNNTTDLNVENKSHQTAISGDASSSQNTTTGSTTSGDAYNFNSTTTEISVSN